MPNWKRVVLSGSNAHLNQITASGNISGSALSTLQGFGSITASKFGNKSSNYTGSFSGDGSDLVDVSVDSINITAENSQNAEHFITFTNSATGQNNLLSDIDLTYNPSTNILTTTASAARYIQHYAEDADNDFNIPFIGTSTGVDTTFFGREIMKVGATGKRIRYNPSSQTLKVKNLEGTASAATYVRYFAEDVDQYQNVALIGNTTGTDGDELPRKVLKVGATGKTMQYNPNDQILKVKNLEGTASRATYVRHFAENADNDYNIPFLGTDSLTDGNEILTPRSVKVGATGKTLRYNPHEASLKVKNFEGTSSLSSYVRHFAEDADLDINVALIGTTTGVDSTELGRSVFKIGATGKRIRYNPSSQTLKVKNLEGTASRATYVRHFGEDADNDYNIPFFGTDSVTDGTEVLTPRSMKVGATGKTLRYNPSSQTLKVKNFEGTASNATYVRYFAEDSNTDHHVTFIAGATGTDGTERSRVVTKMGATGKELLYNPSSRTLTATTFAGNATTATTATGVDVTENNDNDETVYITFVDGQTGTQGLETDSALTYNPSTNIISAGFAESASFASRITLTQATASASSSLSSRTQTLETTMVSEQTNIDNLQTDSGSFSTRITNTTASIAKLITDSGSFSGRTTTLETTMTAEQSNIDDLESKVGQSLNTSNSPTFAGMTISGNISASGDITAQNYIVRSTVTTITSSFSSGSTIFGDDQQDTHKFTGSLLVTGSLNIVGDGIISGSKISASNIVGTNLIQDSSSFSSRIALAEATASASSSFSTRITTESTNIDNLQSDSGSFSTRLTNTTASIAKLITDSGSFSTRITNATASISNISHSLQVRIASTEAGAITGITTSEGSGLSGGTTSGTSTLSVNFGDESLQTAISGAFTSDSSSFSSRVTLAEATASASSSFSSRITLAEATASASSSFSSRIALAEATASASSSFSTRITTESTNIDNLQSDSGSFSTRVTNLKTDSGSFSTRITTESTNIDNLESKVGQSLNTSNSPTFAGLTISGNISASGDITAQNYIVRSTVTTITSSFSSGSTIFGDSVSDTHIFTGSLFLGTGSISSISQITASGNISTSGDGVFNQLKLGGGTFTSASLAAGASSGGIFSGISGVEQETSHNLHITGSVNISSSLTVKPTNSSSTAINTTNINAGFPTANRWQDNLEGSYFNNFDHNTNVSEILRFMAGIISHSIDTASPTANTKTYGSVSPSYTDGTHSSKDTILNGVLGSSYEDGRLSKAWTGSAYIDLSETGSYKLALNYLQHKGWVQSSERGTNSDDVGTNPFHGSYASRIPSNITTQGTYATLTHTLSATAGGSSTVYSNSNHFGLGGLTSGGATEFKVRVMATQSFSDNYADATPDENSTFTRNAVSTLTQDSFGTTSGVTLAKINSANPAVIPAAFQDGIFSSVAGALSGRQNHGGSTTSTNISASGYYAIHGVKAGIATGSGNFSFQSGTSSTTRFYLYTGGITTDITDGAPTGTALGVTGSFIKTKNSCVSRSFSGAPYVASLQVNYTIAAEGTKSFDPVYNANSNARTPLRVYLDNEAAPSPMSTTLSTATVLVDSNGVDTAVTSGLKRGVFDRTKTTQRSDGDTPNISDICIVSASYSQSIAAGGNITDITKISGNLSEQRYARTFGYQGRNWQGNNRTVTDPSNAQRYVLIDGSFGQPASSGSLAVYTRTQGTDPTSITTTTEAFLGEDHRRRIDNGLLANTQGVFTTDLYATVDRKSAIDTQHGSTTEVPCMPGSYDLQVKPGYLVDPGSNFRYWFPSGYNSSQTYKYYIRTFQTDGGTKSSMTVRLRNEGDGGGGTTLQNWNSTGAGYAAAILFESSTTAGNNTSFSTARLYDVADQSNNVIEAGVSADNFKNPFTDDIDLYGSKDGSTSSGTYTVPLRNADGMYLDANDNQLHLIIRHKAASSSNPEPLTSIIVSFS